MLVNINGSRCIGCAKFTQYYQLSQGEYQRIDRGFCGARQCTTRPGDRCRQYRERSNVSGIYPIRKEVSP